MRAIALAMLLALCAIGTAQAHCESRNQYCHAVHLRHALKVTRHQEAVEAHRAHVTAPRPHPLPWRVAALQRAVRWHRERLQQLRHLPTYVYIRNMSIWNCIHMHESPDWAYNGFYEGGLQMDDTFSWSYGPDMYRKYHGEGPHAWSPHDQLVVAQRGEEVRGFEPWSTHIYCGV